MSRMRVAITATIVAAILSSGAASVAAAPTRAFGVGLGRYYGGRGAWLRQTLTGPIGATAAAGYFANEHAGWELGVQAATPMTTRRWFVRATVQYGTYARREEYENGHLVNRTVDEGWGVGAGVGVRAGPRQWFVLDLWHNITPLPAGAWWIENTSIMPSLGFLVGDL